MTMISNMAADNPIPELPVLLGACKLATQHRSREVEEIRLFLQRQQIYRSFVGRGVQRFQLLPPTVRIYGARVDKGASHRKARTMTLSALISVIRCEPTRPS